MPITLDTSERRSELGPPDPVVPDPPERGQQLLQPVHEEPLAQDLVPVPVVVAAVVFEGLGQLPHLLGHVVLVIMSHLQYCCLI